ncbi:MAG: site-2 protease family protein [Phycisphaerales bacterium]|nr:MAG: site-2 protease family protein [Phycisphaerales bacterium]
MSETKGSSSRQGRGFFWLIALGAIVYVIVTNFGVFGNILRVLLGFGAVVLVHEFGHFIIGKVSGIKVEAFSIFMPPILLGIKRTDGGMRIRILPEIFPKQDDESGEGRLSFTVGGKGRAWDTEYRVGLIPFGGFVKMLGQDDIGPVKKCDDPRSFANKPALTRVAVITAGVVFNVVSAVLIFMVIFLAGIKLPPAVIGGVEPGSPAAKAGLRAGDEVIEVGGKSKDLDFTDIGLAAALSKADEAVKVKVRRVDGSVEDFAIVPEQMQTVTGKMRLFGVAPALTLTVAQLSEPKDRERLLELTGFSPGDRITGVNGAEVRTHWEMTDAVEDILEPEVTLLAERTGEGQATSVIESSMDLDWLYADRINVESEGELYHVCSMVPRLRISYVSEAAAKGNPTRWGRIRDSLLGLFGVRRAKQADVAKGPVLEVGDIVVKIGDVNYPTYAEMRRVTKAYKDRTLRVTVLRTDANGVEESVTVNVQPRHDAAQDRVLIGINVALNAEHAVVAKTIEAEGGPAKLEIPRGSVITAVDGVPVSDFYEVVEQIRKNAGERITLDYRLDEKVAGAVGLGADDEYITVKSDLALPIPLETLLRVYKANGPVDAVAMGYRKTLGFITQTYVTLKRLAGGLVGPKNLMGPVGIMTLSYRIAKERPLIDYVYFLGLISAVIGVFNFLPLPPLDGGLVALLLIEKIKGSALSERVQAVVIYTGWALIGTLILYVTFNDIVRSFFS